MTNLRTSHVALMLAGLFVVGSLLSPVADASVRNNSRTVVGEIKAVDLDAKTILVDTGLKDVEINYTEETKIKGGELSEGKDVRISVTRKSGETEATRIKVKG